MLVATQPFLVLLMEQVETVAAVAVGHRLVLEVRELLIPEAAAVVVLKPQTVVLAGQA